MTTEAKAVSRTQDSHRYFRWHAVAFLLTISLAGGCSVRTFAVNQVGDALATSGSSFGSDNDIELVGAAAPFSLKLTESILAETPDHRGLLLAASRGFVQYAYAYVEMPADEMEDRDLKGAYAQRARARRLYIRARNYGLRGLETSYPGLGQALRSKPDDALSTTTTEDVELLYWTAVSWGAAISLSKDNPRMLADLPIVEALARRALVLDEDFDHGAIHVFLISYEMGRAGINPGAARRARAHYERALQLSAGHDAAPYVTFAEAVCVTEGNRAQFHEVLQRAVRIDVNAQPDSRLVNLIMQRRARWLLARTDQLFLD